MTIKYLSFVVLVCAKLTKCNNYTNDKYYTYKTDYQDRHARLLSFNYDEQDYINVELDFNVPFLSIPVKPTADMAKGSFANLNIGAVVLAGGVAIATAVFIPVLYKILQFKNNFAAPDIEGINYDFSDSSRTKTRRDAETSTIFEIMALLDRALAENNIDTTSCVQRAVCWTVQNSNSKLSNGEASSTDKIIDGLATNGWLQQFLEGSVFKDAIRTGLNGENCSLEYKQCMINQKSIQMFATHFISAMYRRK